MLGTPEIILIFVAVILLFGGKKIPELAKGLGRGIKDFKKALSDDKKDTNIEQEQKIEESNETKNS